MKRLGNGLYCQTFWYLVLSCFQKKFILTGTKENYQTTNASLSVEPGVESGVWSTPAPDFDEHILQIC